MQLDQITLHSGDISDAIIGVFCGTPVRTVDFNLSEDLALELAQDIIIANKAAGESPSYLEVLPGEEVCADGIIRRTTSAEARGEVFYNYELPPDVFKVSVSEAQKLSDRKTITWRPNRVVNQEQEFAIIHEELS